MTKVRIVKAVVFPVVMCGCENCTIKKAEYWINDSFQLWCREDSWESLGQQGDKTSQSWIFIGRTDDETEAVILWPTDAKSRLTGKDPEAGKDWRQEEKGTAEDKMVGWHHWLDGHEFEQALGDSKGQGSLACCSPWGCKESDPAEWLNSKSLWWLSSDFQQSCSLKKDWKQIKSNGSSEPQDSIKGSLGPQGTFEFPLITHLSHSVLFL